MKTEDEITNEIVGCIINIIVIIVVVGIMFSGYLFLQGLRHD